MRIVFCAESTIHYSPGLVALGKDKKHELALKERLNNKVIELVEISPNLFI